MRYKTLSKYIFSDLYFKLHTKHRGRGRLKHVKTCHFPNSRGYPGGHPYKIMRWKSCSGIYPHLLFPLLLLLSVLKELPPSTSAHMHNKFLPKRKKKKKLSTLLLNCFLPAVHFSLELSSLEYKQVHTFLIVFQHNMHQNFQQHMTRIFMHNSTFDEST